MKREGNLMPIKQIIQVPAFLSGQNISKIIRLYSPGIDSIHINKAIRNKDIRLNNIKIKQDQPVIDNSEVICYWPDTLAGKLELDYSRYYEKVFDKSGLIVVNKKAGLSVHFDNSIRPDEPTLLDLIRVSYSNPQIELCHRLDRNTSGLIMLAADEPTKKLMEELIKQRLIKKYYRCLVRGIPQAGSFDSNWYTLTDWLEKDENTSNVYIHKNKKSGDKKIVTKYRVIRSMPVIAAAETGNISELEIELVTGRTHQIRAHLASIGNPLLGDGKYGRNSFNQAFAGIDGKPLRHQQLTASTLELPSLDKMSDVAIKLGIAKKTEALLTAIASRSFRIEPAYDFIFE
ncbi:MAG: RluA family pseudouridine synthase [Eubacteriales bacterium]|nr:RluA family pseudouridine synthase [Eubacteriales bacterium]